MQHLESTDELGYKLRPAPHTAPRNGAREVIVLPGFDGTDVNKRTTGTKTAKHLLRTIRFAAEPALKDAHCSVVVYHKTNSLEHADEFGKYYKSPGSFVSTDAKQFVDEVLLPRLGLEGSHRPTAQNIIERLSRITFVTHSYGAIFAQQVANGLRQTLTERHYDRLEIDSVLHAGVVISTAGPDLIKTGASQFTTLRFRATNDETVKTILGWAQNTAGHFYSHFNHVLRETGYDTKTDWEVKPERDSAIIYAKLPDSITYAKQNGSEATINEKTRMPPLFLGMKMDRHHLDRMHWYADKNAKPEDPGKKYIDLKLDVLDRAVHRAPRIASAIELLGPRAKDQVRRALLEAAPTGNHAADARGRTENKEMQI